MIIVPSRRFLVYFIFVNPYIPSKSINPALAEKMISDVKKDYMVIISFPALIFDT
jgi:hypothetical protein